MLNSSAPRSGFLVHRIQARCFALASALFCAAAIVSIYWPRASAPPELPSGGKDLIAYAKIVQRVHDGDSYYDAAAVELRAGGYNSSAVFNWRLPTYAWVLGAFPNAVWGQVLLAALALLTLGLTYGGERQVGGVGRAAILAVTMAGAFLWCVDGDAFYSQELWSGVLIALSVAAFANGRSALAIAAGLAALCFRELAIVYVVVCLVAAARERKVREIAVWIVGVLAFMAFFAWHAWQVGRHLTGTELSEAEGWIQFGGPAFVVRTSQMNVWFFNLPEWVAAIGLSAGLYGLVTWSGPIARRVVWTILLYVLAFLIVGKPFNNYWGLLYVALVPYGLVRVPEVVRAAWPKPAIIHTSKLPAL